MAGATTPTPDFTEPVLPVDLYPGEGPYVAVSACVDEPRGTRHASLAEALNAVEQMDLHSCGPGCRSTSRHRAVALANRRHP